MEKKLHLEILTPYGRYLSTDVDYLGLTSITSALGILPNHTPLITKIEICKIIIKNDGVVSLYATSGGILHIEKGSKAVLLLDSIESSDEIDIDRALKAKERAETLLLNKNNDTDIIRAKAALSRALNRLSIKENK